MVRDVLATGPFAQWSRTAVAPGGGAVLVGDAADFFDPFTGQGIYAALRGAELLAQCLIPALGRPDAAALAPYDRPRRREFRGRCRLARPIGAGLRGPRGT